MRKNELLVPASSLEVLKIAVIYGADAVYIGGEAFGLRAKAKNFTMEEMAEGIAFAHARGVKVYVTANILAHNYDLDGVREYLRELQNMKPDRPDALIMQIRQSLRSPEKYARILTAISVHRQTTPITEHFSSGRNSVLPVW